MIPQQIIPDTSTGRYAEFARELVEGCIISDPWIEGLERFRLEPVVLSQETWRRLSDAAEAIGRLYDEFSVILWNNPAFLDNFFHLTPFQKLMWLSSGGEWHGIARLDLFLMPDGTVRTCEMNSDTPSGEAETVIVNQLLHRDHPHLVNPNAEMEQRFVEMVLASYGASVDGADERSPTIGIVYPTELTEDLSMITLYRSWFESRGMEVMVGSPFNIHCDDAGRLHLFDTPIDVMIRHYKTDWWSERIPVWLDEDEYNDPDPLDQQLIDIIESEAMRRVAVVNPFGSVITQNKLTMAFFYTHFELFSPEARQTILSYVPETYPLSHLVDRALPKNEWTLKSDYGCEGDEVILGPDVSEEIWNESLEMADVHRWVAQRYFEAAASDGMIPNYGVYLIAGETAGIFTRLSPQATDYHALTAPTFIVPDQEQ